MLLSLILVIGCGLGWLVHLAQVELDAVVAIEKIGGKVRDDRDPRVGPSYPPPNQSWPRSLSARAGLDLDGHVISVNLSKGEADAVMAQVGRLDRLVNLNLNHSDVNDASLAHLRGLTSLRGLWLNNDRITDAGLVHLKRLTGLQGLYLGCTLITDSGLAHLEGLTNLTELSIHTTKVTDSGLVHLRRMTKLRTLRMRGTAVTDAGLEDLKTFLPGISIVK
jgi:hypothetical protein